MVETASLIAMLGDGGGGDTPPALVSKSISDYLYKSDSPYTVRARDEEPRADGYDEVDCDISWSTGYENITENGTYHAYDNYDPDDEYAPVGYYEIDVNVTAQLKIKQGTTLAQVTNIVCGEDIVIDETADEELYVGQIDFYVAVFGKDWRQSLGGVLCHGTAAVYPYMDTIKWSLNNATGTITGTIDFPAMPYNWSGKYLGDEVYIRGGSGLAFDQAYWQGSYYNIPEGVQPQATFSYTFDSLIGFGDSSHQMYIKKGNT